MFPSIQDYKNNEDIKLAVQCLEKELEEMIQRRESGHWLSPQLETMLRDIQLMKWAIEKIKAEWDV